MSSVRCRLAIKVKCLGVSYDEFVIGLTLPL